VKNKHLRSATDLIAHADGARKRAMFLDIQHATAGKTRPEERNPSSGMYKLVDVILAAFPPRD
jgi:hypothetical protein